MEDFILLLLAVVMIQFIVFFPMAVITYVGKTRRQTRLEEAAAEAEEKTLAEKASTELAVVRQEMASLKEMLADMILEQSHQRKLPSEKPEEVTRK